MVEKLFEVRYSTPSPALNTLIYASPAVLPGIMSNMTVDVERSADSEKAYQRALILDPNFDQAKKNIAVLYQKVQALAKKR